MSILIKGMKMPKNCDKCILSSSMAMRCDATKKSLVTDTYPKRPSWCPLVKAPESHGRLIDADEFEDELYEHEFSNWCDKDEVSELIDNMQTVIESEEQEHE